jgi:hypothetical protein
MSVMRLESRWSCGLVRGRHRMLGLVAAGCLSEFIRQLPILGVRQHEQDSQQ